MNNDSQQILEKAIQKAIDNGFYSFAGGMFGDTEFVVIGGNNPTQDLFGGGFSVHIKDWPPERAISVERILFNHDFAKALWPLTPNVNYGVYTPAWEYHLQQMVIADDPIKYLGANI